MSFQFNYIPRHCTCTTPTGEFTLLAIHQKTIEKYVQQQQEDDKPCSFPDIMSQIGVTRICCRRFLLNQIKLFLNSNIDTRVFVEGSMISQFFSTKTKGKTSHALQDLKIAGPPIEPAIPFP